MPTLAEQAQARTTTPVLDRGLVGDLRRIDDGRLEVRGDRLMRGLYATDASIHQQMPVAVCVPSDISQVGDILNVARQHGVPVLGRGAGTSLAGQTTTQGIVIDFTKHLDQLISIDIDRKRARVQPGVVRDRLNSIIKKHGLMFAPETSTSNRATLGGMIANNSSGSMSIRYGRTSEHVHALDVLLADGTRATFRPGDEPASSPDEEHWRQRLMSLATRHRALIDERWPRVLRRVGGYSLDELALREVPHFGRFLAGSEGTLALILEADVELVEIPPATAQIALHYGDFIEALRTVPAIVAHNPLSVELMDGRLVELSRANPSTAPLCGFITGEPGTILTVEQTGATREEALEKLRAVERDVRAESRGCYHVHTACDDAERASINLVRKLGLGVMTRMIGDAKPISFIEDACVPVERLADYMSDLREICREESLETVVYGHASVGVLHFKPILNLKTREDLDKMDRVASRAVELVRQYKGSWSGEHGDGILRGGKNDEFWGGEMMDVFRSVKRLFDPRNLLNPGKIVDTPAITEVQRFGPSYHTPIVDSFYHYRDVGGFTGAVEMCNGVGACRKTGSGTMCPSYMATHDEQHTTRGRANALRLAMSGQWGPDAMTGEELHEALDLCLECKACATECPSTVDMSRLKSEVLAIRHARHGATIRDHVFASLPSIARAFAGPFAAIANFPMQSRLTRRLMSSLMGLGADRSLPPFASRSFSSWWEEHHPEPPAKPRGTVALFLDTYTQAFEPNLGQAFVRLATKLGYVVELADVGCCQRPAMSKGFLKRAKDKAPFLMRRLAPFAQRGVPVVVLEPSCWSSLAMDLPDMMDDPAPAAAVRPWLMGVEQWLDREVKAGLKLALANTDAVLHGHCHQKALQGTAPVTRVAIAGGWSLTEIPSGCCGMAGSFGYEAEHVEISKKIGEDRLLPAVRAMRPNQVLIASGFSCRHQIADLTGAHAVHLVEALADSV